MAKEDETWDTTWEGYNAVLGLLSATTLPLTAQLSVLTIAWLAIANHARDEAMAFPDGFPTERNRQIDQLEKMLLLIRDVEPDLEAERLFQEGDVTALMEYLKKKMADAEQGGA